MMYNTSVFSKEKVLYGAVKNVEAVKSEFQITEISSVKDCGEIKIRSIRSHAVDREMLPGLDNQFGQLTSAPKISVTRAKIVS